MGNDKVLQKEDTSVLQTPLTTSTSDVRRKLFTSINMAENHTSKIFKIHFFIITNFRIIKQFPNIMSKCKNFCYPYKMIQI